MVLGGLLDDLSENFIVGKPVRVEKLSEAVALDFQLIGLGWVRFFFCGFVVHLILAACINK